MKKKLTYNFFYNCLATWIWSIQWPIDNAENTPKLQNRTLNKENSS